MCVAGCERIIVCPRARLMRLSLILLALLFLLLYVCCRVRAISVLPEGAADATVTDPVAIAVPAVECALPGASKFYAARGRDADATVTDPVAIAVPAAECALPG